MRNPHNQKGMSAIGWLLVIAVIGLFALVAIKLIPVYIRGYEIGSSMDAMANDTSLIGKSPLDVKKALLRRLDINMIYDIHDDDIDISRSGNGYTVEIDYEPRIQLFGNLYFVVVFDKSVNIPGQ